MNPLVPSSELTARIQGWIDELHPEGLGDWTLRVCKEELNAFPPHGNSIYLWAIRPDGTLRCLDHQGFAHPSEPETDPLTIYAVLCQGARSYPELEELIPAPPEGTYPCGTCGATGMEEATHRSCSSCSGLGWVIRIKQDTHHPISPADRKTHYRVSHHCSACGVKGHRPPATRALVRSNLPHPTHNVGRGIRGNRSRPREKWEA